MTNFQEQARRGLELMRESNGDEVTKIAEPHNDDLTGIALNSMVYGVDSRQCATVTKELVVLAFAMGYKQAQADAIPIDEVWK